MILILLVLGGAGYYLFKKNIGTVNIPSVAEIPKISEQQQGGEEVSYLKVPDGFKINIYAKNIPDARVIVFDKNGHLLISQPSKGKISVIEKTDNSALGNVRTLVSGLDKPHGLAFHCDEKNTDKCSLYVAENSALTRFDYDEKNASVSGKTKLLDIEHSVTDRHFTRTLLFLSPPNENTLLISVGSSCNVCHETGKMRGKILAYDISTGKVIDYATGLRNAVFLTENPINQIIFLTEMGRDNLGDNLPPDEINMIDPSFKELPGPPNFGWPICYGKNIHDDDFDKNKYIQDPCKDKQPSWLDLHAHSAPLGLAFLPDSLKGWGQYRNNLFIAFHGSWNSSVPTGYKIVRTTIDGRNNPSKPEDFITGWLTPQGKKFGRPVDIKIAPNGLMYISDDLSGVIYQVSPNTNN